MTRAGMLLFALLLPALHAQEPKPPGLPQFDSEAAGAHEIKPHRRSIPVQGAEGGFHQLHLTLTVSPDGDVTHAEAAGDERTMKFWPELQGEVEQWRFRPFEKNGKPVTAAVEEYLDVVPEERLPKVHGKAPEVGPNAKVVIQLQRSGCFGSCPAYAVTLSTDGIVFEGSWYVVATGTHTAPLDADAVRTLAREFTAADFYSFDPMYRASVTDCPSYQLSIVIDGDGKYVFDYMGTWVGMPAVIRELEDEVDSLGQTDRWVSGSDGLVSALRAEKFDFETYDAQITLKAAASRGQARTVAELLEAGVPLKPLPAPTLKEHRVEPSDETAGWLTVAASYPESLAVLIEREASKDDQVDKDFALARAANSGSLQAVRTLIAFGANPNSLLLPAEKPGAAGRKPENSKDSVLIEAAASGNPEVVREILRFHPKLETRDIEGQTALFMASESRSSDVDGARVECVRLLVEAGAKVNARDEDGNTPLHETFLTDVEEELLQLGADVNARNHDGETPIFTTVDVEAIALFAAHGADFTIRNKEGETAFEASEHRGPEMQAAILAAMQKR